MNREDCCDCKKANSRLVSIGTWEFRDLQPVRKALNYKYVLTKKNAVTEEMEWYNCRLVAKHFY